MNSNGYFSHDNVLAVTFGEHREGDPNAYKALTDLIQLGSQGQIAIAGGAVITREVDGRVTVKSDTGGENLTGMVAGGMIGLLLGIIGGPLGVLLGGTTGALFGSVVDLDEADTTQSVLGEIATRVQPGRTAVLVQVTERSPEVIDTAMARLGGDVVRFAVSDVEAEIAAAEEAQRQAKRTARKELHEARAAKHKDDARAKVDELKTKLHPTAGGVAA